MGDNNKGIGDDLEFTLGLPPEWHLNSVTFQRQVGACVITLDNTGSRWRGRLLSLYGLPVAGFWTGSAKEALASLKTELTKNKGAMPAQFATLTAKNLEEVCALL